MKRMVHLWPGLVAVGIALGATVAGQSGAVVAHPDLTGLWDGASAGPAPLSGSESAARLASGQSTQTAGPASTRDLVDYMKSQGLTIPFTPFGAERYKNADMSKNPNGFCLPPGPSRALTGPSPFVIVQHADVISFNFENHGVYRVIYLDGRKHPADIDDYPQFMGHSIGRWEGDTLVVDTVGINDRTWLDSYGLEHSNKLQLTERFQKTGPDVIKYTVTYTDPVFFTKPWSASLSFERQGKDDRLMEYVCTDNEKDRVNLVPTLRGQ
jgi:hypothetical protein